MIYVSDDGASNPQSPPSHKKDKLATMPRGKAQKETQKGPQTQYRMTEPKRQRADHKSPKPGGERQRQREMETETMPEEKGKSHRLIQKGWYRKSKPNDSWADHENPRQKAPMRQMSTANVNERMVMKVMTKEKEEPQTKKRRGATKSTQNPRKPEQRSPCKGGG